LSLFIIFDMFLQINARQQTTDPVRKDELEKEIEQLINQ